MHLIHMAPALALSGAYASCRFTGATNFVELAAIDLWPARPTNYSIGGARTDNTQHHFRPQLPPNTATASTYELRAFAASGTHFTYRDLIALSIGGNDLSAIDFTGLTTRSKDRADRIERYHLGGERRQRRRATCGIRRPQHRVAQHRQFEMVSPAARGAGTTFTTPERDAWANTYYQQTQIARAAGPIGRSHLPVQLRYPAGARRRRSGPVRLHQRYQLRGRAISRPGAAGREVNYAGCFYENSVHPTGPAMALIAAYMANQIDAPTTVVPQGSIATSLARGFTASVLGRLDAQRGIPAPAGGFKDGGPESGWSVYGDVNYGGGTVERQFLASGYDYGATGGLVGAEYRVNPGLAFGGVFGYSNSTVSLGVQNAHGRVDSYQLAAYGSFTGAHLFSDALIAYGRHEYALDRQGVIDTVHGSTAADTFTAAAKTGYLVDVGAVRAGPIAGVNYTGGLIGAYTETGDSLLTWMVNQQTLDSVTGNAGVQVRFPFELAGTLYSPFIDVAAEHYFPGSARTVTTTLVTAPLLPVLTPVPGEGGTYGKVAAGVASRIAGNVSATFNAETTFAHEGGNGVVVNGGIKVGF